MLSDAQWSELEPLVEACRPKARTPLRDLRRTLSAIHWRHQKGARCRAISRPVHHLTTTRRRAETRTFSR